MCNTYKCVICKKDEIEILSYNDDEDFCGSKKNQHEEFMWEGGVILKGKPSFGSVHDGETFYIAICDSCLSKLKKEGMVNVVSSIFGKIE